VAWHRIERGDGRPLVLLHGIGMSAAAWEPVLDGLTGGGRRVIAFDMPGFGETPVLPDGVEPTPAAIAQALGEELGRLGINLPVDIAGNSLGGYVALEAARLGLARSVVGLSPAGLWPQGAGRPRSAALLFSAGRRGGASFPGLTDRLLRTAVGRTVLMSGLAGARPWRMPAEAAVAAGRAFAAAPGFDAAYRASGRDRFRGGQTITVPVTVAYGSRDVLISKSHRQRDQLPSHTRWLTLRGCGHVPMWDDPEQVTRVILEGTG
jgi:pimeloyl-ACP methyl ester carboxylesterase